MLQFSWSSKGTIRFTKSQNNENELVSRLCDSFPCHQHIENRQPLDIIHCLLVGHLRLATFIQSWVIAGQVPQPSEVGNPLALGELLATELKDLVMKMENEKKKHKWSKSCTFITMLILIADHGEVISIQLKDLVMNSESAPARGALLHHLGHIDPIVFVPEHFPAPSTQKLVYVGGRRDWILL